MNDYVVPKEVIEWAKEQAEDHWFPDDPWLNGYQKAMQDFLDKINVVYTKETNNVE